MRMANAGKQNQQLEFDILIRGGTGFERLQG
jgi:hypothetical protein